MNHDVTIEERTRAGAIGPPKRYTVPLPHDLSCCVDCPYPDVGFICWSPDGSCLKTDMEKLRHPSKGR